MVVFAQKWLYSSKVVVFGQNGCIRAKEFVFGEKWLYLGEVVVVGQKWLNSSNLLHSDKSGRIR